MARQGSAENRQAAGGQPVPDVGQNAGAPANARTDANPAANASAAAASGASSMSASGESTATNSRTETPRGPKTATVGLGDTQGLLQQLAKMFAAAPNTNPNTTPKPMEEYKFWRTQPVMKFDEAVTEAEAVSPQGVIEERTVDEIAAEARRLPAGFEWSVIDLNSDTQLEEIYHLLHENYVEDDDAQFRFRYSAEFLRWALKPPGWYEDWSVGVRASTSGKLVGFISAIPTSLTVRGSDLEACEVNFMCVHKQLRHKRLAPVLITEITRRVNLRGRWQAMYTGGIVLPAPVSTCRYYHRTLDWEKLYHVGFSYLPENSTPQAQVARFKLPEEPSLAGFRRMKEDDLPQVHALLRSYLSRFELVQTFTEAELKHWLFGAPGILEAFVVERDGKIEDFTSYYGVESTVIGNAKYPVLRVAYSFYYATSAPKGTPEVKTRLSNLFESALIEAKKQNYDVFNALTLLDNPLFLDELKFGAGDGLLHYYLFNYRTPPINGGVDQRKVLTRPGGLGVVML